jgi:hypothetical protein
VAEARFAWGPLSERHRGADAVLRLPEGMSSLQTPYVEAGLGVSNLFRLFRIDVIWRLTHREPVEGCPAPPRFTVNAGFDVKF